MKKPRLQHPRKPAVLEAVRPTAPATAPALPTVAITREQAEIILAHQQAVQQAQTLLTTAYRSVLAGHGITQWSQAGLATDAATPTVVYIPTPDPKP